MTGVVDQPCRHTVGHVVGADQIDTSNIKRVDPQHGRTAIEQALHRVDGCWTGNATVRACGCRVGRHAAHRAPIVINLVRAGKQTACHERFDSRRPRIDRVGTNVAPRRAPNCQQRAVGIESRFELIMMVACSGCRRQMFGPVLNPLDRGARQRPSNEAQRKILGIDHRLCAEASTHVGSHDPDL